MEDDPTRSRPSGDPPAVPRRRSPAKRSTSPAKQAPARQAPLAVFVEPKITPVPEAELPEPEPHEPPESPELPAARPDLPEQEPATRPAPAPVRTAKATPDKASKSAPKKVAAKKTARKPAAAKPPAPPTPEPPTPEPPGSAPQAPAPALDRAVPPPPLWERLRSNPRYGAELLALAAVETLGRQAARHTRWLTATYPQASPYALAEYARRRYARRAGLGTMAGLVAGPAGRLLGAAALAWAQASLVLHIAAAYGHDPTDSRRAAELLVLLRIRGDLAEAEAALAAATADGATPTARRTPDSAVVPALRLAGPPAKGAWRPRQSRPRPLPGAAALVAVLMNTATVDALARRAVSHYRDRPATT